MKNYLNFENEIKNIESEIDKLKDPYLQSYIKSYLQIIFQQIDIHF